MMIKELDVDWAYVDYENQHYEYMKDYQARLKEIPIEDIEKFLRKKNLDNIEI